MRNFTVPKPPHGSPEWLAVRWRDESGLARISASNAAAVHGEHPYLSPAQLAVELLKEEPPQPQQENRAMQRGNTLESPIRDWAAQLLGFPLTTPCIMYAYEEDGVRLIATIDAVSEAGGVYEIKTKRGRWNGELPRMWYWQGVQQAICTGKDSVTWVVFDSDLDIQFHEQKVTSDEKRMHIEACRQYLASIDMGIIPDGISLSYEDLTNLHPKGNNVKVEIGDQAKTLLREYSTHQAVIEQAEAKVSEIKARLCELLGDAEYGTIDNEVVATWKTATRTSFDSKKFEAEHPALAAKYKKQSTYRTFRVVNNEGDKQ